MVTVSILYPRKNGSRFDMEYYLNRHMPLSIDLLSAHPGFNGVWVERGVAGATPGAEAPYVVLCHFRFDAVESFLAAFTPHRATLQGDIATYTDIEPVIQFSDVVLARSRAEGALAPSLASDRLGRPTIKRRPSQ